MASAGRSATNADNGRPSSANKSRTMAIPVMESRTFTTSGSITPPLPSPPRMAFDCSMTSTTLASPTAERTTLAPENPSAIRSIMRLVDKLATNTPGPRCISTQVAAKANVHSSWMGTPRSSTNTNRSASGSWANPTTASELRTRSHKSPRWAGMGSAGRANTPCGSPYKCS